MNAMDWLVNLLTDKLELITIKSVIINIVYQQEGETEW